MKQDGQLNSLTERLRLKTEADRQKIEELTANELQKLAKNLSAVSQSALNSMQATIQDQLNSIESSSASRLQAIHTKIGQTEAAQKRWPLWSGAGALAIGLTILIGLWVLMAWQRGTLSDLQAEIAGQEKTLAALKAQTGSLKITRNASGLFLELSSGAETGWTCNGKPCTKIGN
jgi:hypothetical protein